MNYREDIQILRGVSILLVVLYHLGIGIFKSGFLGVDIFFVISGFLMSILYKENNTINFYKRRALRILPAYFVTIIVTLIVVFILAINLITPDDYEQTIEQALYSSLFVPNIAFWLQNSYFDPNLFRPLLHLWSLGVEIQFYLIVPIIFFLVKRSKIFFWLLSIVSISLCFAVTEVSPRTSFFILPFRLWEFMVGYGAARYLTDNGNIKNDSYSLIGSVCLCNSYGLYT